MSSTTLYRWSGIILIVGSLIGAIGSIMSAVLYPDQNTTPQQVLSTPFTIAATLFLVWSLLVTLGLPGLYLRQAGRAGRLGFAGFVLLSVGLMLGGIAFANVQATVFPYLAESAPKLLPTGGTGPTSGFLLWILVPLLLLGIGNILLGIATMRARVFPRWTGILLIVAGVLFLLSFAPIPYIELANNVIFFVAIAWCGYTLIAPNKEPVAASFATAKAQASH